MDLIGEEVLDDDVRGRRLWALGRGLGLEEHFLLDEVDYVLGRFPPNDLNTYLGVRRDGRGQAPQMQRPLRQRLLNEVIAPYRQWKSENGHLDWNDLAVFLADNKLTAPYDVVIVDEAQDFGANQIRAVVNHVSDDETEHSTTFILDILSGLNVTATFFLVGEQVERRPALAATIIAGGHEIGVHCFRHGCLLRLSPRQTKADLTRAATAIAAVGARPRLYRPPHGVANLAALAVARRNGWAPLLWSHDGRDWQRRANATSIANRILRRISAGDVILLHDADHYSARGSWCPTAQALPRILRELRNRGYPIGSYGENAANAAKSGS